MLVVRLPRGVAVVLAQRPGWFGPGGNVDSQIQSIFTSGDLQTAPEYTFHAWPLIWSTILTTVGAVVIAFVCALFISVFIVEFAPEPLKRVLEPVVRLLASVPSVIYGLVAVLVLVPFIGNHLISAAREGVGHAGDLADRLQPAGGGADPDGDDRADHDRGLLRGAALGAPRLDRGVARRSGSIAGGRSGRSRSARRARRWSPAPCWPWRGRSGRR